MNASTTGRQLTLPIAIASMVIPLAILGISFSKPFTIDDTLFMTWSRHIFPLPGEKRVETINWEGNEESMVNQTRHYPPGWSILIAGGRRICGDDAGKLRLLLQLPFAAMFLFGSALLAHRFGAQPWPVFWLCSTSPLFLVPLATLMPDIACLGPAVLGISLWLGATTLPRMLGAACLVILSAQMKQTVLPILPLLFFQAPGGVVKDWRRVLSASTVIILAGVYPPVGNEHPGASITGHASWILNWAWSPEFMAPKLGYALAVFGALVLSPIGFLSAFILPRPTPRPAFTAIKKLIATTSIIFILSNAGFWKAVPLPDGASISPASGWTLAWFQAFIILFIAWAWQAASNKSFAGSSWLIGWIVLSILGNMFGTPFPAARFLVFVLPALCILFIKDIGSMNSTTRKWILGAAISGNLLLGAGLLHGDRHFALASREGAERGALVAQATSAKLYTTGHWGLQYYVEKTGGKVLDLNKEMPKSPYLILLPEITDHRDFPAFLKSSSLSTTAWSWNDTPNTWYLPKVRTVMPRIASACFYGGNVWLPFGFYDGPFEKITVVGNFSKLRRGK